jgi:hypothetical protein
MYAYCLILLLLIYVPRCLSLNALMFWCVYSLIAVSLKVTVFWDVAPCGLVEVYWHLRDTCCLLITLMMEEAKYNKFLYVLRRCHVSFVTVMNLLQL